MTLSKILNCSEDLLKLAKDKKWDDFLLKLNERELLISEYQKLNTLNTKKNDDQRIILNLKTLNDKLMALTIAHREDVQGQLLKLFKETSASKAYTGNQ